MFPSSPSLAIWILALFTASAVNARPENWGKTKTEPAWTRPHEVSSSLAPADPSVQPPVETPVLPPSGSSPLPPAESPVQPPASPSIPVSAGSSSSFAPPRPTNLTPGVKNPKRGLAFAASKSPMDIHNANQTASLISWQYNWANIPPAYLATSNIPFVPMQWGSGAIDNFVDAVRAQGAEVVLGFNEPDYDREANMDPEQAASLWMSYIEPLKQHGVRLGGPAVTSAGTGRPWLRRFFRECSRLQCTIDFLPVHWYGFGITGFYDYLWSIHNEFPEYPIWVTEYADISSNDAEVYNFMNASIHYLDELEWVERYAWFGFFRPEPDVHYNMLRADGGLNALGELYIGAETVHTHVIDPFAGYKTFDGADYAGQPIITTFPALYGAAHCRRAVFGQGGLTLLAVLVTILSGSLAGVFGMLW
ncbi:glycosyl hydrolase 53 domain-containing protein [Coprinopsis cinerea okayama7|uniref:Glycosyl hydrolase 53 domain-containing protein n=1 Tax=Coprinopsis cinerea (strain Okayama-7 / 130 / ATCC MYA-4618 / FGSC 9003) TaxID=240176 RepID=A8N3V1_COPC7|nr:glycosyl hydrolase 53 domain-containing protein [Coprinopsis cinerea okayama7\|eukprot:XP_001829384.1 glycosyl hydrolase 53 domain-containing protein [Coprinopsis cinerea okayama7\